MSADALSDLLWAVKLTGAVFFTVDVPPPWSAPVPNAETLRPIIMPSAQHLISFHLVTAGGCWAIPQHSEPVWLEVGDVIVFPGGDPHVMCSDLKAPTSEAFDVRILPPIVQWPYHISDPTDRPGRRLGLICGFLGCDVRPFNPLLAALPRTMVVSDRSGTGGWLGQFMRLAVAEATAKRAGSEGVLGRLSELMFVEAVRMHLDSLPSEQTGWLAGLRDRHVGGALSLMHGKPAHPWTIEELRARSGCRARHLPIASCTSSANRRCTTSRSGVCRWQRDCCRAAVRVSRRSQATWDTGPRPPSAAPSRSWSARRPRLGAGGRMRACRTQ